MDWFGKIGSCVVIEVMLCIRWMTSTEVQSRPILSARQRDEDELGTVTWTRAPEKRTHETHGNERGEKRCEIKRHLERFVFVLTTCTGVHVIMAFISGEKHFLSYPLRVYGRCTRGPFDTRNKPLFSMHIRSFLKNIVSWKVVPRLTPLTDARPAGKTDFYCCFWLFLWFFIHFFSVLVFTIDLI